MEIETICRYQLLIVIPTFNNGGIHGDAVGITLSPTGFVHDARYDKLIGAFGGVGYHVTDTSSLSTAVTDALRADKTALINVAIDSTAGTERSIQNLNPKMALANCGRIYRHRARGAVTLVPGPHWSLADHGLCGFEMSSVEDQLGFRRRPRR